MCQSIQDIELNAREMNSEQIYANRQYLRSFKSQQMAYTKTIENLVFRINLRH